MYNILNFPITSFMSSIPPPENRESSEGNCNKTLVLQVAARGLRHSRVEYMPEVERLSGLIAAEIQKRCESGQMGQAEQMVVEITGFPGVHEIVNARSSAGIGSSALGLNLVRSALESLSRVGIKGEEIVYEGERHREPDTQITVRQWIMNEVGSYDFVGGRYKRSRFQYFVRRLPQESDGAISSVTASGADLTGSVRSQVQTSLDASQ